MADEKVKIEVEVDSNADETAGKVKSLKVQLREARLEFEKLQNSGTATADELKKAADKIDDVSDKIDRAKFSSGQFEDKLAALPGPLGKIGSGLKTVGDSFATFGKSLTIGLGIIGLLVTAFFAIKDALGKTEEGTKALSAVTSAFNKVLAPLLAIFENLGLIILPVVTKGLEAVGRVMNKVAKLFGASDTAIKQTTASLEKNNEAANTLKEAEEKRLKELEEKRKLAEEARKKREENAKKAFDDKLKRMEAEDRLDEARLKKLKEEALALATTEQEKLDVEKKFAELSYKARLKDLEDKQALYNKDSVEYKALQTEKTNAEADYISQLRGFGEQQKKIDEDNLKAVEQFEQKAKEIRDAAIKDETEKAIAQRQSKYQKDLADLEADKQFILKSETEKNELRKALAQGLENDLEKIKTDARAKELESQLRIDEARLKALQENTPAYFEQQRKIENDAYEAQKLKAQDNAKELEAIEINHKANLRNIDMAEFEAKKDLQAQIANLYGGFGRALQELAGKNKKLAIAGLLIEQAAGIASIIINTQKAAAKAGYFTPLGIATLVAGAASVAAAIAATVKGIQNINKVETPGGGGAASTGGGASAAIQPPTIPATAAPQIETTGGTNPSAQIAETIGRAQQPIRAYVVSGEISSQQALDRRTNRAATFVGG